MRQKILEILNKYKELLRWDEHSQGVESGDYGVSADNFDKVTDEITNLLENE